ncbi:MAG: NAD(P)-dependent oxidoreductase, partial [Hyphomicrobium denitrificans]|nr:NAD(P)-dependent oxidoreductase [Hyphomicrobium denitrificans]
FVVSGFDVDPKACKSAACKGIAIAPTPGQAVVEADLVIVLVAEESDVERVLFGPDGVVARAKPETTRLSLSPGPVRATAKRSVC